MTGRLGRRRAVGLASLTAAFYAVSSGALAFNLDGRVTADDNYTTIYQLEFRVTNVGPDPGPTQYYSGGSLRLGRDAGPAGDVWLFLDVPISIVDNVFGTSANSNTGWPYGHTFSDLESNERFNFSIKVNGTWQSVSVDYIDSSAPWNPGEFSDTGNVVEDHYTSLQYNLVNGLTTTTNSPDPYDNNPAVPANWVRAVQYELRLDGTKFPTMPTIADLSNAQIWASPNKLKGDQSVTIPCLKYDNCLVVTVTPSPGIAEPASAAILLAGLTAAGLFRRRRRRAAA